MKTDTIEIKKLTPSEGMYLTNGETIAEGVVYLGKNDNEENWHEITAEEKEKIEAEKKAEMEAEEKEMNKDSVTTSSVIEVKNDTLQS